MNMSAPPPPGAPRKPGRAAAVVLLVLGVAATGLGAYILRFATKYSDLRTSDLYQALAIGGGGLLLLALGLQRLIRGGKGWAAAAAALVLPGAVAGIVLQNAVKADQGRSEAQAAQQAVFDQIEAVCTRGQALPAAAAYDRAPGLHRVVFFTTPPDGNTYAWWGEAVPARWRPKSVAQVQLVACVKSTDEDLQDCEYRTRNGETRDLSRVRHHVSMVLYEAKTRTELLHKEFVGSEPDSCPDTTRLSEYSTSNKIEGSLPSDRELVKAARPWIEVGTGGPPSTP